MRDTKRVQHNAETLGKAPEADSPELLDLFAAESKQKRTEKLWQARPHL
ncbi:hypothetical protein [Nostoc sp. C052]|nr:hypothetical protein [Nostoc sp. C052]